MVAYSARRVVQADLVQTALRDPKATMETREDRERPDGLADLVHQDRAETLDTTECQV